MRLNLENLTSLVGDNSEEVDDGVLGHHVEDEVERDRVLFTCGNRGVVAGRREVPQDSSRLGSVLGKGLRGLEHSADERHMDWPVLMVGDINQSLGDAAIHKLDTEDVGIGKGGLDIDLKLGRIRRSSWLKGRLFSGLSAAWTAKAAKR